MKVTTFIVDTRNLFFLIYILLIVFSLISMNWVKLENSLAAYLPSTSETSIGLDCWKIKIKAPLFHRQMTLKK